ncbi:MAG: RAMP superfamily CRISPR-associated protein [Pseudomonadota bacterium]
MLKRTVNSATVDLTITPIDPMLIKSGQATVSGVDMAFVQTYRSGAQAEPFIPGSSLKGVVRSYAEKICRSLRQTPVPVCLPYVDVGQEQNGERGQASCGLRIKEILTRINKDALPSSDVYRISCPACRMFGSQYFIGRLCTSDGYLTEAFKQSGRPVLEIRDGVAIDRLTGGPAGSAKYDLEVLTKAEFGTRIEIHNFERWQIGLLGLVLRDMEEGLLRIGMGKSRGLGRIEADVKHFEVTYFGKPQQQLIGLAKACTEDECAGYGLFEEKDPGENLPEPSRKGLRYSYDLTSSWKPAMESALDDFVSFVRDVAWPGDIDSYAEGRRR